MKRILISMVLVAFLCVCLILTTILVTSIESKLGAKTILPQDVVASLEYAAERPGHPNHTLTAAVITAISEHPRDITKIVSLAIALAPLEKEFLIENVSKYFPGYKNIVLKRSDKIVRGDNRTVMTVKKTAQSDVAPMVTDNAQARDQNIQRSEESLSSRGNKNYYLSVGMGAVHLVDALIDNPPPTPDGTLSFYPGYVATGALGYRFSSGFRTELEIAYRFNNIDEISFGFAEQNISAALDLSGDVSSVAYMINLLYDFSLSGPFEPFVGLGFGLATINAFNSDTLLAVTVDDSDTVLATQLMLGNSFRLFPSGLLGLKYYFFFTENPEIQTSSGAEIEGEYYSHNITAYLTYEF